MTNAEFVHLHNHTEYSRFDGLNKTMDFVLHARFMGFNALAITDHGNMGGWIKFFNECKRKKDKNDKELLGADGKPLKTIKPIFGQEFYLARDHTLRGKEQQTDGRKGNRHILLLAKNWEGYRNIAKLSQLGFTEGQAFSDPRIDLYQLAAHSKGIICSTACLGSVVNINFLHGRFEQAKLAASVLLDIFGRDNFYISSMFHGIDAEGAVIPEQIKLARILNVPIIAENDCHFCKKEQAQSQELLMAISTSRCLKDPKRIHFPYPEFYLKSADEMAKIFGTNPRMLTDSLRIADSVEDFMKKGDMRLPHFNVEQSRKDIISYESGDASQAERFLKEINDADICEGVKEIHSADETQKEAYNFLCELAEKGMKKLKWDTSPEHIAALKKELGDVQVAWDMNRMDFATYFLIVWEYISFARRNKIITGCGRGSGYASVLLRCLGITYGPDPLKYGLLWERFLGFDTKYVLVDSDWGFGEAITEVEVPYDMDDDDDDLEAEREVESDEGGVDRY